MYHLKKWLHYKIFPTFKRLFLSEINMFSDIKINNNNKFNLFIYLIIKYLFLFDIYL